MCILYTSITYDVCICVNVCVKEQYLGQLALQLNKIPLHDEAVIDTIIPSYLQDLHNQLTEASAS